MGGRSFEGVLMKFGKRRTSRGVRGQTSTEYILVIAVLGVAMVGAAAAFSNSNGPFQRAMAKASRNMETSIAQPPAP